MGYLQLAQLSFDNRFARLLPADPEPKNYRRQVAGAIYSYVKPAAVVAPQLVCGANDVAELLQLSPEIFSQPEFVQVFSGNQLLPAMAPYACCYGGHQFGSWAGQLGDGRAINLGEVVNAKGEHWTLQLKGAGPTPYSRTADGLAVLRSSLREFLCSEAMFHLGVPTTRALSLIITGEQVRRDMFYDGNPQLEAGAVVCRVAPSFTRFGNFELPAARGDIALLKQLVDFTIRTDFSELLDATQVRAEQSLADVQELTPHIYLQWFTQVCISTAQMVAHWMRVGFVHGVMNTDNMSILGLTIDYGPYGWLEGFDLNWTPNTTDAQGRRYRFGNQAHIAHWNLLQLANAIYPLINEVEPLQAALAEFRREYTACWQRDMANKLGLSEFNPLADQLLVDDLQSVLQLTETDMTIFYRNLASLETSVVLSDTQLVDVIRAAYYRPPTAEQEQRMLQWLRRYSERLQQDYVLQGSSNELRRARMNNTNPKYVLRNYLAQQAITLAEQGDYTEVQKLLDILRNPYAEQPEHETYFALRPEWARHKAGCSMLSCSS